MSRRLVAVFGSSEAAPGCTEYEAARRVGRGLGANGFGVLTGGYAGVMEAASRGARDVGAPAVGVTCETFGGRPPNRFLTGIRTSVDLHDRCRELIDPAAAFVVLHGRAGTLAEIALLWALERAGCLGSRPVVVLGSRWPALLDAISDGPWIEASQVRLTRFARDPDEAVDLVVSGLDPA